MNNLCRANLQVCKSLCLQG